MWREFFWDPNSQTQIPGIWDFFLQKNPEKSQIPGIGIFSSKIPNSQKITKIYYSKKITNPDLADQQIGRGDAPESECAKESGPSSGGPFFDDDGDDEVPVNYAQVNYGEGKTRMKTYLDTFPDWLSN